MTLKFKKMHGLGNDFVILDCRNAPVPDNATIRALADRRRGVGCDQILVMEKPQAPGADILMSIYNPDGSKAGACGNGTRCVARLFMEEQGRDHCVIETVRGLLSCRMVEAGVVEADMGKPALGWKDIPLAEERDTLNLGLSEGGMDDQARHNPVAVSVGNPHTVFFVDQVDQVDLATLGPQVERHVLFPERTNVEFAQMLSPAKIRVRVWERGTGITQACGSGACAVIVAAVRRGLSARKAEIILDGGSLMLEWRAGDDHVLMTGPATYVYEGIFESSAIAA